MKLDMEDMTQEVITFNLTTHDLELMDEISLAGVISSKIAKGEYTKDQDLTQYTSIREQGQMNELDKLIPETTETCLWLMDRIRPEIERGNFIGVIRLTQHFYLTVRYAALFQERNFTGVPIIEMPDQND